MVEEFDVDDDACLLGVSLELSSSPMACPNFERLKR